MRGGTAPGRGKVYLSPRILWLFTKYESAS